MEDRQHARALIGEDFGRGTLIDDDALFQADDFCLQDESFFDVVGDGKKRDAAFDGVLLDAGEKDIAERAVDPGEGFVEKQEVGYGDGEGAGEVDALTFAAGEIARQTMGERSELEEVDGCVDGRGMRLAADVGREGDVLADGEVREQDGSLRSVGQIAAVRGDAAAVSLQLLPTAWNAAGKVYAGVRYQPAGRAKDRALAASGGAEDDGPGRGQLHPCGNLQSA
jgi:hypothetical protein